ncbi:MAG: hypothetical protein IPJ97_09860 [Proteobacteria bacterium]|nr:hypothetical protein [Pseudomonadota bacterium]
MREAKIQHAYVTLRRDHHVAGLEIHVQYTARVRVRDCVAEVAQDVGRRLARQLAGPHTLDQIAQQLALEQLHRDEVHVAVAIEVEDVDDAWMGQRLRLVRLATQCLQRIRTMRELFAQHFDGHVTMRRREVFLVAVQRPVHGAHATAAKLLLEHIALTQHGSRACSGPGRNPGDRVGMPRRRLQRRQCSARGVVGQLRRQRTCDVTVRLGHCTGLAFE